MKAVRCFITALVTLTLFQALSAQTATDYNMGATMSIDGSTIPATWRFSWWGRKGHHYLVQRNADLLQPWTAMPGLNPSGADAPISYAEFMSTTEAEPKMFFRAVEFSPLDSPLSGNLLADLWEQFYFGTTEVDQNADPDGDSLTNWQEYLVGTNPLAADTDGDGMPDYWEVRHGLDPKSIAGVNDDAGLDPDGDGKTNLQEYLAGTDPRNRADNVAALPASTDVILAAPGNAYYGVKKLTGEITTAIAP